MYIRSTFLACFWCLQFSARFTYVFQFTRRHHSYIPCLFCLCERTPRYLDDLLNIDNIYFDQLVGRIYLTELQSNKANSSYTEAPFLDLNLCISNGRVSTKIYDKRDDFDFNMVNFPYLDGDVPCRTSYGVNKSQLIRFARASSNLNDFKLP